MTGARAHAKPHTDLGNAERLVAWHGRDLKYVHQWGPMCWDGRRWKHDETGEFARRAKATVRGMLTEAASLESDDERRALVKWATASERSSAIRSMIELAETELEIAAAPEDFDRDPMLLNVANGTLDLRTLVLRPHRREDLITKLVPVAYDEHATCPTWERFLREIMGGREEMVAFLKRSMGYSVTGDNREQRLFFLHGDGQNGKGAFIRTAEKLFGDYYSQAAFDSFLEHRKSGGSATPDIARLVGRRFVSASESGATKRVDEGLLKALTGQDTIPARLLYRAPFEFRPTFKLWLVSNEKPPIRGTDFGIWRRLLLIPFDVTISPDRVDHNLEATLQGAELPGILRWVVEGCVDWQCDGLRVPALVADATQEYRSEQDTFAAFLVEHCIEDAGADEGATALLSRINATLPRVEHFSPQKLAGALKRRGFRQLRNARGVRWLGLRLRASHAGDVGVDADSQKFSHSRTREDLLKSTVSPTQPALGLGAGVLS